MLFKFPNFSNLVFVTHRVANRRKNEKILEYCKNYQRQCYSAAQNCRRFLRASDLCKATDHSWQSLAETIRLSALLLSPTLVMLVSILINTYELPWPTSSLTGIGLTMYLPTCNWVTPPSDFDCATGLSTSSTV